MSRGQEDRLASLARLVDAVTKRLFHQWVEAARRLVEDKELGSRHEGGNEDQLLAIALRVSADLLGGVEIETLDQLASIDVVHSALHTAEQVEGLGAGERWPQARFARHIGQMSMGFDT